MTRGATMLSIEAALERVLAEARPLAAVRLPVADCLDRVLAEDVASDVDSPPHDKSTVDGYAVVADGAAPPQRELELLEEITAGAVPTATVRPGTTTRLMTGAPLPAGADAVVKVEESEIVATRPGRTLVRLTCAHVSPGQNIVRRGAAIERGEVVVRRGCCLRPIEIGLLAEVGCAAAAVYPQPRVAVLATGNELVAADVAPGPGQIRNSNGPMLAALVRRAGGVPIDLGIGPDEPAALAERMRRGLAEADVLVIAGGVSAGVLDLVPGVLKELGVSEVFHKIRLKPGKPLWFGVARTASPPRLVFGLPGNPVSSLVCFELFVRPALGRLAGLADQQLPRMEAALAGPFVHRGERPTYHPARLVLAEDGLQIEPLVWRGSGDLRALAAATALAVFPAGERNYAVGEVVEAVLL